MSSFGAVQMQMFVKKARKDGLESAVCAMPKSTDDLEQAHRVAGLITLHIGLDMSDFAKGLRFMHKNFDEIYPRLQALFQTKVEHLQFGLCQLLADFARDRVIRDKLLARGAVEFLVTLLPSRKASLFALKTLQVVSSHAGPSEQESIAKITAKPLVDFALAMDHADERYPVILATIAHGSYVNNETSGVPTRTMVNLLVDACSHPDVHTHSHAVDGLFSPSHRYPKYFRTTPKLLRCFLGHLRAPDPRVRFNILWGLYSMLEGCKKLAKVPALNQAMVDWGMAETDTARLLSGTNRFSNAIGQVEQDKDYVKFGRVVRSCMRLSEFAIAEGSFKIDDGVHPLSGKPQVKDVPARLRGGDFHWFTDALPLAVKALRKLDPDDLDATCIELKYLMIKKRWTEGHRIAEEALAKFPDEPYLYYALTIGNPSKVEGLKWAKRGLRKNATGYIQRGLLMLSFEHSFAICEACLDDVDFMPYTTRELKLETGLAHIASAFEDAETFIAVAPPDARHLRMMILRYLNLIPIVKGNSLSPDLRELRPLVEKLAIVDEICVLLYDQTRNTQQRLVWNFIAKDYEAAAKEWDPHFRKFPEAAETVTIPEPTADKGLVRLLESMSCSGGDAGPAGHYRLDEITELLRCSSCSSPSAKLLRCSGCAHARYCDPRCQRNDWKTHKALCRKK